MKPYYQLSDNDLRAWGQNFADTVGNFVGSYGITNADFLAIQNALVVFAESLVSLESIRQQAAAAQAVKDAGRSTCESVVGKYVRIFRANPAVPNDLLVTMGLPSRDRGTAPAPVSTPKDGRVQTFDTGLNRLDWNGNGNPSGTTYVVEVRYGMDSDWTIAGISRRPKVDLPGCPVGVPTYYRVFAQRGARRSDVSSVFMAYGQELAAA